MNRNVTKKIAIVYGAHGVNAVGLIRSLGEAGFYVIFASIYRKIESKWLKEYWRLPDDEGKRLSYLSAQIRLLPSKPALYPTDDHGAAFLDIHAKELSEISFCPHANGKLAEYINKSTMTALAEEAGLHVPHSTVIRLDDCSVSPGIDFPFIVKPLSGLYGNKGTIRICYNSDDWENAWSMLRSLGATQVILQEFIASEDRYEIGLMGVSCPNGDIVIPATIKKIRSYPSERGSTSYANVLPEVDTTVDLEALTTFIRRLKFVGIFDVEMIVSQGVAYFIEINCRNGQYGYAITAAGYNLPLHFYEGMNGRSYSNSKSLRSISYINERDDFQHVRARSVSLREWLKQFKNARARGMYCPGDQWPFIRQYFKIPDRVILAVRKLIKRFHGLLVREEWTLAYRGRSDTSLYNGNHMNPFKPIRNTIRYWCADPFIVKEGDVHYIFFEMFDRFKGKGVIGYRELRAGHIGKMKVAYEEPFHLSFPYVFKHDGEFYMMPEASEGNTLFLLKAKTFPTNWEKVYSWDDLGKVCDSVILNNESGSYLLTTAVKDTGFFDSLNVFSWTNDSWKPLYGRPAVTGATSSRMGGIVFDDARGTIRVAQNCSEEYGKSLSFYHVRQCDSSGYFEEKLCEISLSDLHLRDRQKYRGIHTYNADSDFEVIDLKLRPRAKWCYLISYLHQKNN